MSTLEKETTAQTQKPYKRYSQDHGAAAEQKGHAEMNWEKHELHEVTRKRNNALFKAALVDFYADVSGVDQPVDVTDEFRVPETEDDLLVSPDGDEEYDNVDVAMIDPFMTPEDFDIKSKREIKRAQERAATLDHTYTEDDYGDSDFVNHVHVRNRL